MVVSSEPICEKFSPHDDACTIYLQIMCYMSVPRASPATALLGPPPGLRSSADPKNTIHAWLDRSDFAATPSPEPILDLEVRPLPPVISVHDRLLEEAGEGRWPVRREDEYIPLTAQSPLHIGGDQQTAAWVTTRLGITGVAIISPNAKVGLGSPIRLHDSTLAQRHDGFESPWLFGILQHILWREPGYYIFAMEPHLFTITKHPYPIHCSVAHVAIANRFLIKDDIIRSIHRQSLGQRMQVGMSYFMPPRRPWELEWAWRHKEHDKIMGWRLGSDPDLERRYSEHHNNHYKTLFVS